MQVVGIYFQLIRIHHAYGNKLVTVTVFFYYGICLCRQLRQCQLTLYRFKITHICIQQSTDEQNERSNPMNNCTLNILDYTEF